MLRIPAINRARKGLRRSQTHSIPAPVGGWDAKHPLAGMRELDAVVLDNWFPKAADVMLRPGCQNWVTDFPAAVRTLMPYNGSSNKKLFAACDLGIYDATSVGVVGGAEIALTNGRTSFTNFETLAGKYLVVVNGADQAKLYNGSVWTELGAATTPALTGVPSTELSSVAVLKKRLWFTRKNSQSAYYLPAAAIAGALVEFPLGQVFHRGGTLTAISNWTVDGGDGSDDYGVFISSEGEVAVYKGVDPASSSTWNLVGTYYVGAPLSQNCFVAYGGEVLVLCQNGLFPLSQALLSSTVNRSKALTDKIDTAFADSASAFHANLGWQPIVFPEASFVLVNVPANGGIIYQYVMNSVTGAWCRFSDIPAQNWATFDRKLFFATGTKVAQAWVGTSDFGSDIVGSVQQAYSYLGNRGRQKHIKLLRPTMTIDKTVQLQASIATDFDPPTYFSDVSGIPSLPYYWDASIFDASQWASDKLPKRDWLSVASRECYAAAITLQCRTKDSTINWTSTDIVYEVGSVL